MKKNTSFHFGFFLILYFNFYTQIFAQSITITSPNGGEIWPEKSFQTITWKSDGTSGYLQIEYSIDNGNNWIRIIDNATDNGLLDWLTPNAPSTNCAIRINNELGNPMDISDDVFTIKRFSCFVPDSLALVALFNSTNGTNWIYKENWLISPVIDWYGVTMEEGRVVELSLTSNNLAGSIPGEFGNLSELQRLELRNNYLTGCIPPEMGNIYSLNHLTISKNQLTGSIPAELGNLTNLVRLYLYENQLSGAVPAEIGNLTKLETLFLYDNNLRDLPDLNSLTSLSSFRIKNNYFTFEDIEPNINLFSSPFNYSPQKDCYQNQDIALNDGDNYVLSVSVGGDNNIYKWEKGGVLIAGMQDSIYEIENATLTDQAVYICDVESPIAVDLVFSLFFNVTVKSEMTTEDSLALVALYNSTNGPEWENNTNWLSAPLSAWYGVSVVGGRVYSLSLYNNNLSGVLPEELGKLSDIQTLYLNGNKIGGNIPPEIGNLINLQYLNLSENQLTNNIPIEIGNLKILRTLEINNNFLTGIIPSEIGNLTELQTLSLGNNQLTGNIPSEIGNLTNLKTLFLNNNRLTGNIPNEIGNLSNLTFFYLRHNLLTGNIPPEIGNLVNITSLDLYSNCLSGNIPPEIGNLNRLTSIQLQYNSLTGSIPPEIGKLLNLRSLYLQGNVLDGTIPPEIGNLYNLEILSIYHTLLTGNIPPEIGKLKNLHYLGLWDNKINGHIPPEIGNLSNLKTLALYNNELTGNIPPEIGNLSNLTYLGLWQNQLTGIIPPEIGKLDKLWYLHLGQNQLTGTIPPEIGNLSNLKYLSLYINELSGSIPPEIGNLLLLEYLSIHSNYFGGIIPSEISDLINLEHFRIHNNMLVDLPQLNTLINLTELTVESNKFTFEDIEPNIGVGSVFSYTPQDSVGLKQNITLNEGDNYQMSVSVGGEYNLYQWYKDGEIISGAISSDYDITNADSNDEGVYECHITNSLVTQLTLYSRPIIVTIVPNIGNTPPEITDIPDQTIDEGETFVIINLDDFVSDNETDDADITWTFSGNSELDISIINRVASIVIPDINWNGSETITFTAYDNATNPLSDSDNATFTVLAVNDAPIITGQKPLSVDEDHSLTLSLSDFTVSDVDNPSGPFTLQVNGGLNYTVAGTVIKPDTNYYGIITVPVTVSDGAAESNVFNAQIEVNAVNDAPVISGQKPLTVDEDHSLTLSLSDFTVSDVDNPSGPFTLLLFDGLNYIVSGTIITPVADYNGTLIVTVKVSDGELESQKFEMAINVISVNDKPLVSIIPDQIVEQGKAFEKIMLDEYVSDIESADADIQWTYTGNHKLEISINNRVATITAPDLSWKGTEIVAFKATDSDLINPLSDSTMVIFTVVHKNEAPIISHIPGQSIDEGGIFEVINLDNYVSDDETSDDKIIWNYTGNIELVVSIENRIATITAPDENWNGVEKITFMATDDNQANPLSSDTSAVFIVNSINDAPVIYDIPDQTIVKGEEFVEINLYQYVDDIETDNEFIEWTVSKNNHIMVEITNCIAHFSIPDTTWCGSDTIIFTAKDNDMSNSMSVSKPIILTVNCNNISGVNISEIENIRLFPNPTEGISKISFGYIINEQVIIEITNINGEIISVKKESVEDSQLWIDLNEYYPGIYYIRLIANNNTKLFKIMKY